MGVYLGERGHIELKRDSGREVFSSVLDPYDVNVERRRFSVDFTVGALITGDQITISTQDRSPLELVADHVDPDGNYHNDWRGYIYVDDAGGIRLYDTFEKSLSGSFEQAVELVEPSQRKDIVIKTRSNTFRCLAEVTSFEFVTTRDEVDVTTLGTEFKNRFEAGLISGSGTIECFWEHKFQNTGDCDTSTNSEETISQEFPAYLARLILRLQQGSDFLGRFYIYTSNNPSTDPSVWYESECIVTNVAVQVEPTQIITTSINFLSTGPIVLHQGIPPAYLLQEDGSLILQEDGESGIFQEDPN